MVWMQLRGADTCVCRVPTHRDARLPVLETLLRILPGMTHFSTMGYSRRCLPHACPEGKWLFLTWHLHGSLPQGTYPPPNKASGGKAFVWMDRFLDRAASGPQFLRQPSIARIQIDSLHKGVALGHYDLGAFVVMANHVHVLLYPKIAPHRLLQSLKGFTAREANRALNRTGEPFWQAESYDHWVRDEPEHARIVSYIENNPVTAGLVEHSVEYPWSSAYNQRLDTIVEAADTSVRATQTAKSHG